MKNDENIALWKKRFMICQTCPHFISGPKLCRKCNCFMPLKTRIKSQRCPIGKWEADGEFVYGD
jgi:hypothetical protein